MNYNLDRIKESLKGKLEIENIIDPLRCTRCKDKGYVFMWHKENYGLYAFRCDSCNIAVQKGLSKSYVTLNQKIHEKEFTGREPKWFELPGRFPRDTGKTN